MNTNDKDPSSQDGGAQMAYLPPTVEEVHSLAAALGSTPDNSCSIGKTALRRGAIRTRKRDAGLELLSPLLRDHPPISLRELLVRNPASWEDGTVGRKSLFYSDRSCPTIFIFFH